MDSEELKETLDQLLESFEAIKQHLRRHNKQAYERWKAGGFLIDPMIISNYPHVEDVVIPIVTELREAEELELEN